MTTHCKHRVWFGERCFACEADPCHFCGGDPADCDCTTACAECGHIGHEHYSDGRCRGTVYDMGPLRVEPCHGHKYEPVPV